MQSTIPCYVGEETLENVTDTLHQHPRALRPWSTHSASTINNHSKGTMSTLCKSNNLVRFKKVPLQAAAKIRCAPCVKTPLDTLSRCTITNGSDGLISTLCKRFCSPQWTWRHPARRDGSKQPQQRWPMACAADLTAHTTHTQYNSHATQGVHTHPHPHTHANTCIHTHTQRYIRKRRGRCTHAIQGVHPHSPTPTHTHTHTCTTSAHTHTPTSPHSYSHVHHSCTHPPTHPHTAAGQSVPSHCGPPCSLGIACCPPTATEAPCNKRQRVLSISNHWAATTPKRRIRAHNGTHGSSTLHNNHTCQKC